MSAHRRDRTTSTEPAPEASDETADELEQRPDPETGAKPDSPTQLSPPARKLALRTTLAEFSDDQCTDLAAALTYYGVLALFPAAIALTSLLGLVGQGTQAVDEVLGVLSDLGAGGVVDSIGPTLRDLSGSQAAGFAFVLGLAGALWSASGNVGAFGRAMNRIYEIGEGRPVWKLRPAMLLLTAVFVVLVAAVLALLVVSGPVATSIGERIGLDDTTVLVFQVVKWPVLAGLVVVIVALLYYFTPNVRQPRFRWISLGAVVAILAWALLSVAFGFYVANFSSYDKTYGALGGVIVFLLWLRLTNVALLLGAELDAEIERGRQLQAGQPSEDDVRLPPRDVRQLRKKERKEAKLREQAREVREHGSTD